MVEEFEKYECLVEFIFCFVREQVKEVEVDFSTTTKSQIYFF